MMKVFSKAKALLASLAVSMMLFAGTAMAAIDQTAVDAQYAALEGDINYLAGKAWVIVFLVVGIGVAIGLFKKFTKKAAGS